MTFKQLSTGKSLDLNSQKDGLHIFVTGATDSKVIQTQLNNYLALKDDIGDNVSVWFVLDAVVESDNDEVLFDEKNLLTEISPTLSGKKNVGENFIVLQKKGSEFIHVDTKEDPENDSNWAEAIVELSKNYSNPDPDDEGYYKWGQIVQEDGEYLCKDCGYIIELEAGQIFPICEVCIAGEPTGPSGPDEGYWEMV